MLTVTEGPDGGGRGIVARVFEPSAETLLGISLFQSLDHDQRAALAGRCRGWRYPARHEIIRHADRTDEVYFLVAGRVRATLLSRSGREVAFRDMEPGAVFGDLSAIDGQPRGANVITLAQSTVLCMTSAAFHEALAAHPPMMSAMMRELSQLVRRLSDRVVEFSTLGVDNRIHAELLRLAKQRPRQGNTVEISDPPTHADIASRVATRRESVSKEIGHLADQGLVERRPGALVLRDLERLEAMVDEAMGPAK